MISTSSPRHHSGFTIVEIIVIVAVIGILATISAVAYTSYTKNATFTRQKTELHNIKEALDVYYTANKSYPVTTDRPGCDNSWCGWEQTTGDAFIPGLAPTFIEVTPQMPSSADRTDTYLYSSNGTDYQLLRYKASGLPDHEKQNNDLLITSGWYNNIAWGYKTNANWW